MDLQHAVISITTIVFVLSSMIATGLGLRGRRDRCAAAQLAADSAGTPGKLRGDAAHRGWAGASDPAGRIARHRVAAPGCGRRFAVPPEIRPDRQGNLALAVGLMVLLMVVTVGYLPLVLPMLLPGVSVNPVKIGVSLVVLDLGSAGRRAARNENASRSSRREQTGARYDLEPESAGSGGASDRV